MPWHEVSAMSLRLEFVTLAAAGGANVRRLCRRFGISPKTGYKWLARYRAGGAAALAGDYQRRGSSSSAATEVIRSASAAIEPLVTGTSTISRSGASADG